MDLLSSITAPTEGIVCQQEKTAACVGNNDLGQGCVFVTERWAQAWGSYVKWIWPITRVGRFTIPAAFDQRHSVPIDLYCYADIDYTVIAVCCNVLYKTHPIAYDGYGIIQL